MLSVGLRHTFPLRQALTVAMGVCLMIVGSKLSLHTPFTPVPVTFQTVSTLFIAMTCSPVTAFLSLLTWITMGVSGLSVFAGSHSGVATIVGPTAGYIWGMLMAVTLMSACQHHCADFFNALFSKKQGDCLSFAASILVGTLGIVVVTLTMGWINLSQYVGSTAAWNLGVAPFLMLEFLKVIGVSVFVTTFQWGKKGC